MNNRIFTPKAAPQICINGHVFDLQLSEIDVVQRILDAKAYCTDMMGKKGIKTEDIIAVGRHVERAINDICGENAMRIMVDGAVVRIREAVELLKIVEEEASNAYTEELLAKNE